MRAMSVGPAPIYSGTWTKRRARRLRAQQQSADCASAWPIHAPHDAPDGSVRWHVAFGGGGGVALDKAAVVHGRIRAGRAGPVGVYLDAGEQLVRVGQLVAVVAGHGVGSAGAE